MRRSAVLMSATLFVLAQGSSMAQAPEALRLSPLDLKTAYDALAVQAGQVRQDVAARRRRNAALHRAMIADRNALPEICNNLPVVYIRNGDIYKNNSQIGRNANNFKANCDGSVAWSSSYGELFLDSKELASRVNSYDLSWYGDTVVWNDTSGELHKHAAGATKGMGRVSSYTFLRYTGDVVWRDSWGDLHRNDDKLGRVSMYKAAERTGDVAWTDSYGNLFKNHDQLGRASEFRIADRTGDVAWKDSFGNLFKGTKEVARYPSGWELREDGVLIWRDSSGYYHYE